MAKKSIGMKKKQRISNSFIYVFLVILSIVWLFPFVYLILTSFRGDSPAISNNLFPDVWTFDNYLALFTDVDNPIFSIGNIYRSTSNFKSWYVNTFTIAAITAIIQTALSLMTAYALSRLRFKGRKGLMQFMLILGMFPGFLTMIAIYNLLKMIGLKTSVFGLILVYVAGSATNYYISKGFFDTISRSLDEAAMIDGASRNTIFWKIILPLSKPIIVYTLLTSFLGPWGDFMMASYLLGGEKEKFTVAVGLNNWTTVEGQCYYFTRFCAAGVIVSIPIVIMFFWLQNFYVEGVTGGAVKG